MCKDAAQTSRPAYPGELRNRLADVEKRPIDYANEAPAHPMTQEEILAEIFKYHPPNDFTLPKFQAINQAAKNLAEVMLANLPPGPRREQAIEAVVLARMMANQAIALSYVPRLY